MIEEVQVLKIPGKDLSPVDLDLINRSRRQEFGSETIIDPQPNNEDWERLYFLAKRGGDVLAFGRIYNLDVTFFDKIFHILGTASLVAVLKGQHFGPMITLAMNEHIKQTGQTSIGFNNPKLSSYYLKHGRGIIKDGMRRFAYTPDRPRFSVGDVNYISGSDRLIEKVQQAPEEFVYLPRPHW
jgi:hypothetical protein